MQRLPAVFCDAPPFSTPLPIFDIHYYVSAGFETNKTLILFLAFFKIVLNNTLKKFPKNSVGYILKWWKQGNTSFAWYGVVGSQVEQNYVVSMNFWLIKWSNNCSQKLNYFLSLSGPHQQATAIHGVQQAFLLFKESTWSKIKYIYLMYMLLSSLKYTFYIRWKSYTCYWSKSETLEKIFHDENSLWTQWTKYL